MKKPLPISERTKRLVFKDRFETCEVCGKPSEDNSGWCDECFAKPEVQKALFRI